TYNKLVRDKIPQIIMQEGKRFKLNSISKGEFNSELKNKLIEEVEEYINTANNQDALEELADVLEVITALAECHESTMDEIESTRVENRESKGGFEEKVFLVHVED
ncbi:MAG: nucleoside triphosphate pyrophosphohydrolase, partial [Campylobacterales bacterium]|nr:nucleoside triphosphate pyrophosphohydrolase [Campylobacterales bacterium]